MEFNFGKNIIQNFEKAVGLEWLETNGLGGYAGSTITGANTRRYHGLLVAAEHPPVGRTVLLSKLDETIIIDGKRIDLNTNQYPGTVHPEGYKYLIRFERNLFPEFFYEADGIEIKKTIAAVNNENTNVIIYEILKTDKPFTLEFLPLVAGRDYHSLVHKNDFGNRDAYFNNNILSYRPYSTIPEFHINMPGSSFVYNPDWYYNFEYPAEQFRGLDYREDLFSPGKLNVEVHEGDVLGIIISTNYPSNRDAVALFINEKKRREKLIAEYKNDNLAQKLILAADQFIVKRGDDLKTIIAGYHWFSDWGRDTMIALPGICLSTGRFNDAKKILKAFARSVNQGMLPNRFPDYGELPEYNTVDATLWFFVSIYKYYQYTKDEEFIKGELICVLKDIIDWHYKGTRYNIKVDDDELLYCGEDGYQLTWMDAKIGNWVVTPRTGKAVEINALWYNALKIYSYLAYIFNSSDEAEEIDIKAEKIKENFNIAFWNEDGNYFYDALNDGYKDSSLRPNQLIVLSLPFEITDRNKGVKALQIIEEKLYTPAGLRSLSPEHQDYKPYYGGDQYSRDSSYHQGTVWSWLLGPYIDALIRYTGHEGKMKAKEVIANFQYHLSEAGVGTISEIFDADYPHSARGCVAQAWSVGEILRVYKEYQLGNELKFGKRKLLEQLEVS